MVSIREDRTVVDTTIVDIIQGGHGVAGCCKVLAQRNTARHHQEDLYIMEVGGV